MCRDSRTQNYVICAADRMLTAGVGDADVEYEPEERKLFPITNGVALMASGDAFLQREILLGMDPEVRESIRVKREWWSVQGMAELYRKHFNLIRRQRAEQEVLIPHGLTYDEYLRRNRDLAPTTLSEIILKLQDFQMPDVPTIVAGLDLTGPHIYSVRDGLIQCHDATGFAAIGIGARHASSQFMLAKHSASKPLSETLRLIYFAKKRSEVAPGVGAETDMCMFGHRVGSINCFKGGEVDRLEKLYLAALKDERAADRKAQRRIDQFVESLKSPAKEQTVWTSTGFAPTVVTKKEESPPRPPDPS
jgi:hypothetical protein